MTAVRVKRVTFAVMKNSINSDLLFARYFLPTGILDWSDLVKIEEEKIKLSKYNIDFCIEHRDGLLTIF